MKDRIRLKKNPPNVSTPGGSVDLYFDSDGNLVKEMPGGVKEMVGSGSVTKAAVNAAIAEDPGATRAAAGLGDSATQDAADLPVSTATQAALDAKVDDSQLSTTGGADKVLQADNNGDFTLGLTSAGGGTLWLADREKVNWLTKAGGDSGAAIRMWEDHDVNGGEFIVDAPWRLALIPHGPIQIGPNDPSIRYPTPVYLSSGYADATTYTTRESLALCFQTSTWTGGANVRNYLSFQGVPLDTSGTNSVLRLWDQASVEGENGGGAAANRGKVSGNLIAEFYDEGIWSNGTAPTFDALTDGATITHTLSKYKTVQAASVTLGGNRTLAFSNLIAGMRGVIYVTQDGTGSRTLTPSGGSALNLSTAADTTDRVCWDFDGLFVNFAVEQAIQREVVVSDADAQAFITAASITDNTQKAAISVLTDSLKTEGLWSKLHAIYPMVGGNATAHSKDLKATSNITWNGAGFTHDANGVTSDGTSGTYGDLGFAPSGVGTQTSLSLSVYGKGGQPTDSGDYLIGANDSASNYAGLSRYQPGGTDYHNLAGLNCNDPNSRFVAATTWATHITGSITAEGAQFLRREGATSNDTDETTTGRSVRNFYLFARNSNGTAANNANTTLAFVSVGSGLTEAEVITLEGIVAAFQTTLGRAN